MILIFDLDDTLYSERSYVDGGFRAVSNFLHLTFGWNQDESFSAMTDVLVRHGRGSIFNRLLSTHGQLTQKNVQECLKVYRHHVPTLSLFPEAQDLLSRVEKPLYLVTDGHKMVQYKKVQALNLEPVFSKIFITNRYGRHHAKPSPYCFEKIRQIHQCSWNDMAYVGDNPAKDFVNLTPLGVQTVRVLTGEHRDVKARDGFDAKYRIENLAELSSTLDL